MSKSKLMVNGFGAKVQDASYWMFKEADWNYPVVTHHVSSTFNTRSLYHTVHLLSHGNEWLYENISINTRWKATSLSILTMVFFIYRIKIYVIAVQKIQTHNFVHWNWQAWVFLHRKLNNYKYKHEKKNLSWNIWYP